MSFNNSVLSEDIDMSSDEFKKLQEQVHERVIVARIGLLLRHPFFGNMATRMKVKNCDSWCPTAATDGRNLYYNTLFFNQLTNKEIEFVIAHEILHCVFDHLDRREDRDPRIYNIAADYIVNNTLIRDRIGALPKSVPAYHDKTFLGWSSEEVYDHLMKDSENAGNNGSLLDEHVDWTKDENNSNSSGGKDNTSGSERPVYSKSDFEKIKEEIKESMMSAAQASGADNVPAEISRMIKELTEPKMNWREILRQQIQSIIKNDYTFTRPNRKGWHVGAVLPGMQFDETIDLCISLDMSGSISDEQARDFLSEIKGIMDEYKDYKIKIWCFDTSVYNEDDFSGDDGRDLLEYQITGGGGTDFSVNWTYMEENDIQPKKFIMFTDGYPWGSWGDEDYCDTIFLIHSNHKKDIEAPFGITVHYEDSN